MRTASGLVRRLAPRPESCAIEHMAILTGGIPYLFRTCAMAFYHFSPIELIEFSKSFENSKIVADRLPAPPYPFSSGNLIGRVLRSRRVRWSERSSRRPKRT
jgi:hypothetical protein